MRQEQEEVCSPESDRPAKKDDQLQKGFQLFPGSQSKKVRFVRSPYRQLSIERWRRHPDPVSDTHPLTRFRVAKEFEISLQTIRHFSLAHYFDAGA